MLKNSETPPGPQTRQAALQKKGTEIGEIISFFKTLALFIIIALFLRASVVEAFKIPSGSMIPTLKIGDHILVSKLSYGFHLPFLTKSIYQFGFPQRGDIVVFTREDDPMSSEDDSAINIIKRVIGLPGDTIEVIGSKVYINNREYVEPYARWDEGGIDSWGPEVVPEGKVLLLGDNRDHSKDSRYWTDPFLPVERVKGRALIIYWTWDSDFLNRIGKIIE
jgi:signal peptidase I